MKRYIALTLAMVLVLMIAVGCAGDDPADDAGSLVFVSFWNEGEPAADWLWEVVEAFEAEYGISVDFTPVGRDNLITVRTDILMGNPPDLIDQDLSEINAAFMRDEPLLLPVEDLVNGPGPEGQASFRDIFPEGTLELFAQDGVIYYVPYVLVTSGFFYNKTMFNELGIIVPTTWTEFIQMGEQLKEHGLPPLALDGTISFYNAYYFYWAVTRILGAGYFSAAAHDETGATWNNPGFLRAAEIVHELSAGGRNFFQPGYEGSAFPAAQSDWALGLSGAVLCGTWIPVETSPLVDDYWEFGFFPFPEIEGGVGVTTDVEAYLMGFAIPRDAANPENAKKFINFALQRVWAERYVELSLNMSPRYDVAPPAVLADVAEFLDTATSSHKSYDGVMSDLPSWWANVFYPASDSLVFGLITPEEFIEQIRENTIAYWDGRIELDAGIR